MLGNIGLSKFAQRQLSPKYNGTRVSLEELKKIINLAYSEGKIFLGYADFCKTISICNILPSGKIRFPKLMCSTIDRTQAFKKQGRLCTRYEARHEGELPVLVEWVEGVEIVPAPYIHLVVYGSEQMKLEGEETQDYDYLIVSIQTGQLEKIEPMKPITAMRNVLGIEFGGSGIALDEQAYQESIHFWQKYISIRQEICY